MTRYAQTRMPEARPRIDARGDGNAYTCPELGDTAMRPGCTAAREYPSRIGNRLHYRDGRVTDMSGNPIAA